MRDKYLYEIIHTTLKSEITEGTYEYGALLPSENQLCQRFHVERTTVRKALELLVKDGLVEKFPGVGSRVIYNNQEMEETRFVNLGDAIAFFILENKTEHKKITEPYYTDLFYFLERECTLRGIQLIYCAVNENSDIKEILSKHHFMAAVFVTRMPQELIEQAKSFHIPLLAVNDSHAGIPCVQHDYVSGSYQAMKYLCQMGHEQIAVITGPEGYMGNEEKLTGCYRAIHQLNVHIREEWFAQGDWTFNGGYQAAQALLSGERHPTAIFAFNDIMAIGAIHAIRDARLMMPDDVSVVGFDNMEQLRFSEPNLTTVDGNTAYLAKIIVDAAAKNAFSQYDQGVRIVIPVHLVKRGSVRNMRFESEN